MKKKAKHNKHVKAETKQTKNLGFLGNGITYARIGLGNGITNASI